MNANTLTPTQREVLAHALEHSAGQIDWFPDSLKGGARQKVMDALATRGLVAREGSQWLVAAAGYEALGRTPPAPASASPEPTDTAPTKVRTRENSKQAEVVRMLQRPEGATINQICEATGWQPHTVRGAFAGTFKKKLGLVVTSEKARGQERRYRIG